MAALGARLEPRQGDTVAGRQGGELRLPGTGTRGRGQGDNRPGEERAAQARGETPHDRASRASSSPASFIVVHSESGSAPSDS